MTLPRRAGPDLLCDTRWVGPHGIAKFADQVLRRLPVSTGLPPGPRLFHPLDPIWLSLTIARLQPRAYFTPGFNPPLRSKRPFVFVVHDLNYVHCRDNTDVLRRAYFEAIVRPACRKAVKVLTVSEYSRAQIIEWARVGTEKVLNVSAGVDQRFTAEGVRHSPGYPYILYVGNRLPHKNLPRLFAAFAQTRVEGKLLLIGDPDARSEALARRFGIHDRVAYAGPVADEQMPSLYRGAMAVALVSLFEGFGLPVVEAMACGIPLLVSKVTSLPEVAGDAALFVDPRSIEEIARGIERIASDEPLRRTLIERGLARAATYSWDSTGHAVRAVLDAIR